MAAVMFYTLFLEMMGWKVLFYCREQLEVLKHWNKKRLFSCIRDMEEKQTVTVFIWQSLHKVQITSHGMEVFLYPHLSPDAQCVVGWEQL